MSCPYISIIRHLVLPGCARGSGCKHRALVDVRRRRGRTSQPCARGSWQAGSQKDPASTPAPCGPRELGFELEGELAGVGAAAAETLPLQRGGGRGRASGAGPERRSPAPLARCVGAPSLALPAPLLLPPTACQRARLPPAPRGAAGAKTAICSQTVGPKSQLSPALREMHSWSPASGRRVHRSARPSCAGGAEGQAPVFK